MSGHRKSFQLRTKVKMARAAIAGRHSGRMTFQNTLNSLAPSMRAASSSSEGSVWMYWRIRKMPKTCAVPGRMTAQMLSISPRLRVMI